MDIQNSRLSRVVLTVCGLVTSEDLRDCMWTDAQ